MITQKGLYCQFCETFIFSNSRHDFVSCKCRYFFIDGGFDYFRGGADNITKVIYAYRDVDKGTLPRFFEDEKKFDPLTVHTTEPYKE